MINLRKALVSLGATVALATGLVALAPSAAHAADTTQTASCTDGGGIKWTAKAVWGAVYTSAGVAKATADYAGWTTNAGALSADASVKTYDSTGYLLQNLTSTDSFDYKSGTAYKVRNPVNPPSAPGRAKIVVSLGVVGDNLASCSMTFTQPGSAGSITDQYEADVLTATNRERTNQSIAALAPQSCVDKYAESQAVKMAAAGKIYHQDLGPVLNDCGLYTVGENVASGYNSGQDVVNAWMASDGHRRNILDDTFQLLGVGSVQDSSGRWYICQVFGAK